MKITYANTAPSGQAEDVARTTCGKTRFQDNNKNPKKKPSTLDVLWNVSFNICRLSKNLIQKLEPSENLIKKTDTLWNFWVRIRHIVKKVESQSNRFYNFDSRFDALSKSFLKGWHIVKFFIQKIILFRRKLKFRIMLLTKALNWKIWPFYAVERVKIWFLQWKMTFKSWHVVVNLDLKSSIFFKFDS